jgi:hypothetical protein
LETRINPATYQQGNVELNQPGSVDQMNDRCHSFTNSVPNSFSNSMRFGNGNKEHNRLEYIKSLFNISDITTWTNFINSLDIFIEDLITLEMNEEIDEIYIENSTFKKDMYELIVYSRTAINNLVSLYSNSTLDLDEDILRIIKYESYYKCNLNCYEKLL